MFVLMFGYVFGSGMTVPGGGDYREFLMPGMFAHDHGVRPRADHARRRHRHRPGVSPTGSAPCRWPARRWSPGRSAADMLNSALGLPCCVAVRSAGRLALARRRRRRPGRGRAAAAAALRAALGRHLPRPARQRGRRRSSPCRSWSSRSAFLSNAFVAPVADARLARRDRRVEPAVGHRRRHPRAVRQPRLAVGTSWPAQHALLLAVVWPLLIVAVFLPLAVRRYHSAAR